MGEEKLAEMQNPQTHPPVTPVRETHRESSSEEKPAATKKQRMDSPVSETRREFLSEEKPAAMKKQRMELPVSEALDDLPLAQAFSMRKSDATKKKRIESPVSETRQLAGEDQPS